MRRSIGWAMLAIGLVVIGGCAPKGPATGKAGGTGASATGPSAAGETTEGGTFAVGFVTNGVADFWTIADKGAQDAARELGVTALVQMPPGGQVDEQKRMVQDLLTKGVRGLAISPIDPANQQDLLAEIGANTNLITHDSDAPNSARLCYVGMNNYDAGRMCGRLVKQALPEGGTLMIFVGRVEQDNARLRRQGLIDELLDRSEDPSRYDPPGGELQGEKFTILDTRTDNFNMSAAKEQPEDAIARYPDLDCMVGLFAYNPPFILEALRVADKLNQVKVVAFDENQETLQAIKDGTCFGTVVQNPYRYGFESVRILTALARGDTSVIPENKMVDIPARQITRENIDEFWAELNGRLGKPAPVAGH